MAFITSLRIKNFFSIDKVNINFKASPYNIEHNPNRLFEFNGEYYNKIISFYGANASGKTTILKSIIFLANVIRNEQTDNFPISFKNKFADININSEIEIGYVIDIDGEAKEFSYHLELKSNKYENIGIKNETLYLINNRKKETFFNRDKTEIKSIDKKIKTIIFDNLNETKSLFQEFIKFDESNILKNSQDFYKSLLSFSNISVYKTRLNINRRDEKKIGNFLKFDTEQKNKRIEPFFLRFFNSIGLDIEKVEAKFKYEDGKEEEFLGLDIFHKIGSEPLAFDLESDGTQMLMKILLDIYFAKIFNSVLIIDEFDSVIHPMITPIIINLLIENNIQIIYTTHNIYNMKFLQTDELFLIEKDSNHKTTINAVKNNPDIKGYKNLLTLYENGYLGGVPKVEDIITKIL